MRLTYNPPAGEAEETSVFGLFFEKGKAVDVKDEALAKKLAGNPMFKAEGEKAPAENAARAESEQRLTKAIDGRTKAAREARVKADTTEAEAAAKERAAEQARAIREAQTSGDQRPETEFLTNR